MQLDGYCDMEVLQRGVVDLSQRISFALSSIVTTPAPTLARMSLHCTTPPFSLFTVALIALRCVVMC